MPLCPTGGNGRSDSHGYAELEEVSVTNASPPASRLKDDPYDMSIPLVQFSSPCFHCTDEEDRAIVTLIRIGNLDRATEVTLYTEDGSAVQGEGYISKNCKVRFEPDENTKDVPIELRSDSWWYPTTYFHVKLSSLQTFPTTGAVLDDRLSCAVVRKLDTSIFPSDVMADYKQEEEFRHFDTLKETCRMWWKMHSVRNGTIWLLGADVVLNLIYFSTLFIHVYFINRIIRPEKDLYMISHKTALLCYGALKLFFVALSHLINYSKTEVKVAGTIRRFMQKSLVGEYFDLTYYARKHVVGSHVQAAIQQHVPTLVSDGYMGMLKIVAMIGKLILMLAFTVTAPFVFGHPFRVSSLAPLVLFPTILTIFILLRRGAISRSQQRQNHDAAGLLAHIDTVCDRWPLVLDYDRTIEKLDEFEGFLKERDAAGKAHAQVMLNTSYFGQWLTEIITAAYVVFGGMLVLNSDLTVGMFLTNIGIYKNCGDEFDRIFAAMVDVTQTFPAMEKIYRLLNLDTSSEQRMHMERANMADLAKLEKEMKSASFVKHGSDDLHLDRAKIFVNLEDCFLYDGAIDKTNFLNFKGNVGIDQGQLVAIVGAAHSGKATLLSFIAGRTLPSAQAINAGHGVIMPPHLRRIVVAATPIFYEGSLFDNIVFGTQGLDADRQTARDLCAKLGMTKHVLGSYFDNDHLPNARGWEDALPESQKILVCIARALNFNAEVTCFHKPLNRLDRDHETIILDVMLEHIRLRGVGETGNIARRRPRTIFYTTKSFRESSRANSLYRVCRERGFEGFSEEQRMAATSTEGNKDATSRMQSMGSTASS